MLQASNQTQAAPVDLVRSRVVANVIRLSGSVSEKRHAAVSCAEMMGNAGTCRPRDDMTRANRVLLALAAVRYQRGRRPELEDALPVEDDEDLLVGGVAVRRRPGPSLAQVRPV